MTTRQLLSAASLAVLSSAPALADEYELDPAHSTAQFSVRHMMVSTVRGQFDRVTGTASLDEKDLTKSKVEVSIEAKSINTREPKRDEHLRSPDFFDAVKFPAVTFSSTKVEKAEGGKFKVTGDLTMRGVKKSVTLLAEITAPVKNPWGQQVRGVTASGKLNRKDWGLTWNKGLEAGGVLVGDEIQLVIDAELNPKKPAAGVN